MTARRIPVDITADHVEQVWRVLADEPTPAPVLAQRAGLGVCTTYQALVRLYDEGVAFVSQEPVTRRIEGWQR